MANWRISRHTLHQTAVHSVRFVKTVVPATVKPVRTLWNEVIGFLFLTFAVLAGASGVQTAIAYKGNDAGALTKLVLTGLFVIVMGGYGISSFRKARRISRS